MHQDAAAAHAKEAQEAEEALRVVEGCKSALAAAKAAGDSAAVEKANAALHEATADYDRELAEAEEAKEAAIYQLPSCVRICATNPSAHNMLTTHNPPQLPKKQRFVMAIKPNNLVAPGESDLSQDIMSKK